MGSTAENIRQRADYTHKYNRALGRHGWLRLTPAYSVKVVEELLSAYEYVLDVLDPFSGTATTALCAAYHGHSSCTVELNPFLVWFGKVKTDIYSSKDTNSAYNRAELVVARSQTLNSADLVPPPIHNIERWWGTDELDFLLRLREAIELECKRESKTKNLLLVAFCRVMINLSNASFNHHSMSFKDKDRNNGTSQQALFRSVSSAEDLFLTELRFVLESAEDNPTGKIDIIQGDSRCLLEVKGRMCDLLITSPPYPNRISYIRELRPYMYWLGFLTEARQAGEMDWEAIGGTWGIATSRLGDWKMNEKSFCPGYFKKILKEISAAHEKNGGILSNYVGKYFEDIYSHLKSMRQCMAKRAEIHYIVGNSSFYGILVPVEKLYCDMLEQLGFVDVQNRIIRKRNSKKELYEFDVSART